MFVFGYCFGRVSVGVSMFCLMRWRTVSNCATHLLATPSHIGGFAMARWQLGMMPTVKLLRSAQYHLHSLWAGVYRQR